MANKLYEEESIQNIANAIRRKNGKMDTYTVSEMSGAIDAIPTGGGGTIDFPQFNFDTILFDNVDNTESTLQFTPPSGVVSDYAFLRVDVRYTSGDTPTNYFIMPIRAITEQYSHYLSCSARVNTGQVIEVKIDADANEINMRNTSTSPLIYVTKVALSNQPASIELIENRQRGAVTSIDVPDYDLFSYDYLCLIVATTSGTFATPNTYPCLVKYITDSTRPSDVSPGRLFNYNYTATYATFIYQHSITSARINMLYGINLT